MPLSTWAGYRDEYLDELVRLKGRGDYADPAGASCTGCSATGVYRCVDCFGQDLVCRECCLARHVRAPLHRIEVSINSVACKRNLTTAYTAPSCSGCCWRIPLFRSIFNLMMVSQTVRYRVHQVDSTHERVRQRYSRGFCCIETCPLPAALTPEGESPFRGCLTAAE